MYDKVCQKRAAVFLDIGEKPEGAYPPPARRRPMVTTRAAESESGSVVSDGVGVEVGTITSSLRLTDAGASSVPTSRPVSGAALRFIFRAYI